MPVVSVAVPVDPSGEYVGLAHFVQFGDAISFVGGINMPKLVQCFDRHAGPLPVRERWRRKQRWLFSEPSLPACLTHNKRLFLRLRVRKTKQQAEARLAARSAGARHRQLVKAGNDDLRQDAVMQQFFALINAVLAESAAARARRLRIATYKVPFLLVYHAL